MRDKIKHIIAGLLIALVVGLPAYLESVNLFAGLWSAATGGLDDGGVKEWCDNNTEGGKWSWKDFAFTAIGVTVALLIILGLHFGKG